MDRASLLDELKKNPSFDIVVIGGGASGLGIALEASTRGYRVLVAEQSDFAKSTSSKSTKLIHGGVRYLAQGDVKLVWEATRERGLLMKNASHTVHDLQFIIPVYSTFEKLKYIAGLKLYDWLAGRLSLGASKLLSKDAVIECLPNVKSKGLLGGVLYHDGQFDDATLSVSLVQTILSNGGVVINYLSATNFQSDRAGLTSMVVEDCESGTQFGIESKVFVNATGVFADSILNKSDPALPKKIAASQGTHIVLDRKFMQGHDALMIPKTSDGRVLFILPWHNKLLVGTTDIPVDRISLEPIPSEKEIDFILENAGNYLIEKPEKKDILSVFAGLRPLAATEDPNAKTKEISRSHKIFVSPSGLYTMLGGKWTSFRRMGQDMIDKIEKDKGWMKTRSNSANMQLSVPEVLDPFYQEIFHGSKSIPFDFIEDCVKTQMARQVEDVLARRSRILFLDAQKSIDLAPQVANDMAMVMGKDANWIGQQLKEFTALAKNYLPKAPNGI